MVHIMIKQYLNDLHASAIEVGGKYKQVEFVVKNKQGVAFKVCGGYLIVDGGYRDVLVYESK